MKKSVKQMKKGNWMMLYNQKGASAGASYSLAYPWTSNTKNGTVKMAMMGRAMDACFISRETWFLRYLGWVKVAWSKMNR